MDDALALKMILDESGFSAGLNKAVGQLDKFGSETEQTGEQGSKGMGGIWSSFVGNFAAQGVMTVIGAAKDGVTELIKTGIGFNANTETMRVAWQTLTGSAQGATDMVKQLNVYAAKTPFDTANVDMMAKYLNNADIKGQDMFNTMTQLGDVGSAFAVPTDGIVEMTRQYSQMAQAQVAYTEDLNVFQDRGIPIYGEVAKVMGTNVAGVREMAGQGKITFDILQKAFGNMGDKFKGSMDSQSQTWTGLMSTLQDGWDQFTGKLTKPLFEMGKSGLQPLIDFLGSDKLSGGITAVMDKMGASFNKIIPLFSDLGGYLKTFEPIGANLKNMFGGLFDQLMQFFQNNAPLIKSTIGNIGTVLSVITAVLGPAVKLAFGGILETIKAFMQIFDGAMNLVKALLNGDWSQAWTAAKELAAGAIKAVLSVITGNLLGKALGGIQKFGLSAVSHIGQSMGSFLSKVTGSLTKAPGLFTKWLGSALSRVGSWGGSLVTSAGSAMGRFLGGVSNHLLGLPKLFFNGLNKAVKALFNIDMGSIGRDIIRGLANGMSFKWVEEKISSIAGNITSFFKKKLGIASPSRVMAAEVGHWILPGVADGMDNGMDAIDQKATDTRARITDAFKKPFVTSFHGNSPQFVDETEINQDGNGGGGGDVINITVQAYGELSDKQAQEWAEKLAIALEKFKKQKQPYPG